MVASGNRLMSRCRSSKGCRFRRQDRHESANPLAFEGRRSGEGSSRAKSVLTVVEVDEDSGTAFLEAVEDSPEKYPWTARLSELVPADE